MFAPLKKAAVNVSGKQRLGIVIVLTGVTLVAMFSFLALSVDTGRIMLEETRLQNAADVAALAAVQEITKAVYRAGQDGVLDKLEVGSPAIDAARAVAAQVGTANGIYIDPEEDVEFGKRTYQGGAWPIEWGVAPYNVVRVTTRRVGNGGAQSNGPLPLAFGWVVGVDQVDLQATATAYVKARDLVIVLDFSASMNDDSSLRSSLGLAHAEAALDDMWDALRLANPEWPGTTRSKFRAKLGQITDYTGTPYGNGLSVDDVFNDLNLGALKNGVTKWPYPQAGRDASGNPLPWPSNDDSRTMWIDYIWYVKGLQNSYKDVYCFRTLMDYLQEDRHLRNQSEDLWRAPHYPFRAMQDGTSQFLNFLAELDFGDEVGLVSYSEWAVQETSHYDGQGCDLDISADPITKNYADIEMIQRRHQGGDYSGKTAMGDGILKARELMANYGREGAQATMLVMTDGNTRQSPAGWTVPPGFDWSTWTDFDNDGAADFTSDDVHVQYAFWEASLAIQAGVTLHTMAVGADANRPLMQAIAYASGGVYIDVPGGVDIATMQTQLENAFQEIAAEVPAASLVYAAP